METWLSVLNRSDALCPESESSWGQVEMASAFVPITLLLLHGLMDVGATQPREAANTSKNCVEHSGICPDQVRCTDPARFLLLVLVLTFYV